MSRPISIRILAASSPSSGPVPHTAAARLWRTLVAGSLLLGIAAGCSHFDPYQHVKPLAQRELPRDPRSTLPPDFPASGADANLPDRMTQAMRTAEELRLGLLDHVRLMGDERSAFEASLFTLSPYLLYQAARSENHSSARRQVLGIGGALTAWGMWLSRRPPEFEAAYVDGAHQIACLLAGSTEHQYTADELPLTGDTRWSRRLATDIRQYREASADLVMALREQSPTAPGAVACAVPGSTQCAARQAALGGGGVDPRVGLDGMEKQIAVNLALASKRQHEIDRLEGDVRDRMPNRLVSRAQESVQGVERTIRERRPELASVQDTVAQLGKSVDALRGSVARAQSSGASSPAATAEFQPARLPPGSQKWGAPARTEKERRSLREAASNAERQLAVTLDASPDPQALRTERAAGAKALLDEMKCNVSTTLVSGGGAGTDEPRASSTALPPRNTGSSAR